MSALLLQLAEPLFLLSDLYECWAKLLLFFVLRVEKCLVLPKEYDVVTFEKHLEAVGQVVFVAFYLLMEVYTCLVEWFYVYHIFLMVGNAQELVFNVNAQ